MRENEMHDILDQLYSPHLITYQSAQPLRKGQERVLTPSKQSPPLCLFTTLNTFLVFTLWEFSKSSLIVGDTK
jgi:hypothetical protein